MSIKTLNNFKTLTPCQRNLIVILLCAPAMMVSVIVSGTAVPCTALELGQYLHYQTAIHVRPTMPWCHGPRLARLCVV